MASTKFGSTFGNTKGKKGIEDSFDGSRDMGNMSMNTDLQLDFIKQHQGTSKQKEFNLKLKGGETHIGIFDR